MFDGSGNNGLPGSWWMKTVAYGVFSILGGMLGHLMRTIKERRRFKWSHTVLEGCAAGFVGLLMMLACQALHLSEQWTGVVVGVMSWLGANATIRILETIVLRKLGALLPSQTITIETENEGETK